MPVFEPMTAAGGLYTSATDLARYLRFQLNDGTIDGQDVLDPRADDRDADDPGALRRRARRLRAGRRPPPLAGGDNADLFSHGGGGFGFLSDLWWSPRCSSGIAVLTNSADHHLQGELALSILGDLVHEPGTIYHDRLLALPAPAAAAEPDGGYLAPGGIADLVAGAGDAAVGRRSGALGGVRRQLSSRDWREPSIPAAPPGRFFVDVGVPYFDADEERGPSSAIG